MGAGLKQRSKFLSIFFGISFLNAGNLRIGRFKKIKNKKIKKS
jgi:hypothetical protein